MRVSFEEGREVWVTTDSAPHLKSRGDSWPETSRKHETDQSQSAVIPASELKVGGLAQGCHTAEGATGPRCSSGSRRLLAQRCTLALRRAERFGRPRIRRTTHKNVAILCRTHHTNAKRIPTTHFSISILDVATALGGESVHWPHRSPGKAQDAAKASPNPR